MAQITDYTSLITSEHQSAARFNLTVAATLQPFVDLLNLMAIFPDCYDLDDATGAQLDAVGLWIGVTRSVAVSVDQFFSFDTKGVGFDQGSWFVVGDVTATITTLDDGDYRILLRAKIGCNSWNGSVPAAAAILTSLVSNQGGVVSVVEGTMSLAWTISGNISAVTQALLWGGYVPLKPLGVSVSYAFTPPGVGVAVWGAFKWGDGSVWGSNATGVWGASNYDTGEVWG